MKQETLATALGIKQQSWSEYETSGKIPDKYWPAIEKEFNMKKEDIQALTEEDFKRMVSGIQNNSNNIVFSYVMNFNINGADAQSLDQLKSLLEMAASLQQKNNPSE